MIIPIKTLMKIFDIKSKSVFFSYQRKFQLLQQILIFDYQECFHDEITFLCLVSLKSKICYFSHNTKHAYNAYKKRAQDLFEKKQVYQKIDEPAHINSKTIGFRFSQVVDISFRTMTIDSHPPLTQLIIFDKV